MNYPLPLPPAKESRLYDRKFVESSDVIRPPEISRPTTAQRKAYSSQSSYEAQNTQSNSSDIIKNQLECDSLLKILNEKRRF